MTLVKRPHLRVQEEILGVVPDVGFEEGVARVCGVVRDRLARRVDY
jgi:hypothetical protein